MRYAETDAMGIVHHAAYLVWMETGRVEWCRGLGIDYRAMEQEDHLMMVVVDARCRYLSAARFDDEAVVRTWAEEAGSRMLRFHYEIRDAISGRMLVEAETKHICVGRDMKPVRFPEKYRQAFTAS